MTRVRVESFTISLDGYGAGPNQDLNNPLGAGGTELHQRLSPTRKLQKTLPSAPSSSPPRRRCSNGSCGARRM